MLFKLSLFINKDYHSLWSIILITTFIKKYNNKFKIMKKIINNTLIIVICFASSIGFSQNRNTQFKTELFVYSADVFNTRNLYDPATPENYDGTPYYVNDFLLGDVYLENEIILSNGALRYNAVADEIEYKESLNDDDKSAKALVKSKEIYAKIMNDTFVFIPSQGYYLVIFDGNNLSLLKKVTKKYFPPKKAQNNYERSTLARFEDRFKYTIYSKNGKTLELPKSKNKKIKAFGNDEKIVESYTKEQKLDLNNEKDIKKLIRYLDKIQGF